MKKVDVFYYGGLVLGVILIFFNHLFLGIGVGLFGLMMLILLDSTPSPSLRSSRQGKNEFEEYQHFKIVNKDIYRGQVRNKINGREPFVSPEKDCGLFNHEKTNVWKQELRK